MAGTARKFLDLDGLKQYDGKVKTAIETAKAAAIKTAKDELINGAPAAYDTLKEIADFMTDGNVAGGLVKQLAAKADASTVSSLTTTVNGKAGKATTLAGYGITDAKISNGTITIGSATITPLTSHQSLTGYVKTADLTAITTAEVEALFD